MKQLITQIEIQAPVEKVWKIFSAFDNYADWNPFIKKLTGAATPGQTIEVILQPPNGRPMTFKPRVISFEPNSRFSWKGKLGIGGLFDGEHIFEFKSLGPAKTLFVQRENFSGILIPFLSSMIDGPTKKGFEAMNARLKELAEQ